MIKKFSTFILLSIAIVCNITIPVFSETLEEYAEELNDIKQQSLIAESNAKTISSNFKDGNFSNIDKDITLLIDLFYVMMQKNMNLYLVDNKNTPDENEKKMLRNLKYKMNNEIRETLGLMLLVRGECYISKDDIIKALYDFEESYKYYDKSLLDEILDSAISKQQYDYVDRIIAMSVNSKYINENCKNKILTVKDQIEKNISSVSIDEINIPTRIASQNTVISGSNGFNMQKEYDLIKQLPYTEYQNFYDSIKNLDPDKQYKAKKRWWSEIKTAQLLNTAEVEWTNYYQNYDNNKKNGIENWQKYYSIHPLNINNQQELKTTEAIMIVLFDKEKYYHKDFYEWAEKVVDDITIYYDNDEIKNRQKWLYALLSKPINIIQLSPEEYSNYINLLDISSKVVDDNYLDSLTKITSNKNFNIQEFLRIYQLYGYYNLPLVNKYYNSVKELYPFMCTSEEFDLDNTGKHSFTVYTEKRLALYDYLKKTMNFTIEQNRTIVEYPNVKIADKTQIVKKVEKNNNLKNEQKYEEILKNLNTKTQKSKKTINFKLTDIIFFPIKLIFNIIGKIFLTIFGLLMVIAI